MLHRLHPRHAAAAACAVAAIAVAPAPAGAAYQLKQGIYDCYAYNYSTGFSDYKGSVKLKGGGRYEHAWGRKKTRFEDKTTGRYKQRGRRLTFKGGAMVHTPGRIDDTEPGRAPSFEVWVDGEASGVTCTWIEKP